MKDMCQMTCSAEIAKEAQTLQRKTMQRLHHLNKNQQSLLTVSQYYQSTFWYYLHPLGYKLRLFSSVGYTFEGCSSRGIRSFFSMSLYVQSLMPTLEHNTYVIALCDQLQLLPNNQFCYLSLKVRIYFVLSELTWLPLWIAMLVLPILPMRHCSHTDVMFLYILCYFVGIIVI